VGGLFLRGDIYREAQLRGSLLTFFRSQFPFSALESVESLTGDLLKSFLHRPADLGG
jgi:hypothetical protein